MARSSWSWVDRNQKSIIVILNYQEFSFRKIDTFIITAFYRARWSESSVAKYRNPKYTAKSRLRCTDSEVHTSKCCLSQSETSKLGGNSRSFNNHLYWRKEQICHWSSGGWVVKLLACGARGPGFDSRPRHLNFHRLVISCFQVEIWLKDS